MKFIGQFFRDLFGVNGVEPIVGGYQVDYSPLTVDQIQAPTPDDHLLASGEWIPVNRKPK